MRVQGFNRLMNHVSVILPYYNRVDVLQQAIRSVLGQTHSDLTLILVDDGSDDGSAELAASVDDPRILLAATDGRRGACAARNVGLGLAETSLVAFQDSDDVWLPGKLASQVSKLRDWQRKIPGVGVVGGGWRFIGEANASREFLPGPFYRADVLADRVRGIGTPMLLVDRARVRHAEFDERMPARQDLDFVLVCLQAGTSLIVDTEIGVEVRRGRNDHVARPENAARAYERLLIKYADEFAADPQLQSWVQYQAAREFARSRKPHKVMANLAGALRDQPVRRAFHLLCGLTAGGKGLALAARVARLWDPRTGPDRSER